MGDFLQSVWRDIKDRKNLELYLVLIVALVVIIADVFGVNTGPAIFGIVLSVLALLTFGLIEDRHASERIEGKINDIATGKSGKQFFVEWDDAPFRERLKTASEVSLLAVANHVFLSKNDEPIKEFLKKGGTLRCILVEPKGNAMNMATNLAIGYEKQLEALATQVELSLRQFCDFAQAAPSADRVRVKLIDHLPYAIMTMIDHQSLDGIMYVSLQGFELPPSSRPSFILHKKDDGKWFTFYQQSFENLWMWNKSRTVELVDNTRTTKDGA